MSNSEVKRTHTELFERRILLMIFCGCFSMVGEGVTELHVGW